MRQNFSRVLVYGKGAPRLPHPDGNRSAVVECLARTRITKMVRTEPFLIGRVDYPPDTYDNTLENKALWRASRMSLQELFKEIPGLPEGFASLPSVGLVLVPFSVTVAPAKV